MRYFFRVLAVALLSATVAAWVKMTIPGLSIGYLPAWQNESLRNILGLLLAMPLFELYFLVYAYGFSIISYGLLARWWRPAQRSQAAAMALGAAVATTAYVLYKICFYLLSARLYEVHGGVGKPWYQWIDYPQDWQLLPIYGLAGSLGGWAWWRLTYRCRPAQVDLQSKPPLAGAGQQVP
jgi:hypothetical protein